MGQDIKAGDWVRVPAARGYAWKTNKGRVEVVLPPYCKVKVSWFCKPCSVDYKIADVEKLKK